LSTTEAQTEFNAIDEKDGDEGDEFKPFSSPPKRTKSTMNHELLLYTSMYYNAVEDKNPLNFWKNAEQVWNFSILFKPNFRHCHYYQRLRARFYAFQPVQHRQSAFSVVSKLPFRLLATAYPIIEFSRFSPYSMQSKSSDTSGEFK
jgi:hypothetical protein